MNIVLDGRIRVAELTDSEVVELGFDDPLFQSKECVPTHIVVKTLDTIPTYHIVNRYSVQTIKAYNEEITYISPDSVVGQVIPGEL